MQIPGWQKLVSLMKGENGEEPQSSKTSDRAKATAPAVSEDDLVQKQAKDIETLKSQLKAANEKVDNYAARLMTAGLMVDPDNRPVLEKVLGYPAESDCVEDQFWAAQTRRVMGKLARSALFSLPVPDVGDAPDDILTSLPGYPDSPDTYREQYWHIINGMDQRAFRANAFLDALKFGHPNDAEKILQSCGERGRNSLYLATGELMAQGKIHPASAAFASRVIAEQKAAELSSRAQQAEARPEASSPKGRSL